MVQAVAAGKFNKDKPIDGQVAPPLKLVMAPRALHLQRTKTVLCKPLIVLVF